MADWWDRPEHIYGWRTDTLLPRAHKYEAINNRMYDTGETRWDTAAIVPAVEGAIKNFFTLPGDVARGEVDPMSEEGFNRAMDMASVATGGMGLRGGGRMLPVPEFQGNARLRAPGVSLNYNPEGTPSYDYINKPGGTKGDHLKLVSSNEAPVQPQGVLSEKTGPRLHGREEPGFFMGPWATKENTPGVTLASVPQKGRRVVHSTTSPEQFDVPKAGMNPDETGLHVSNDPNAFNLYSAPSIDEFSQQAPRSYPMVQATGGVLSQEKSGLLDYGPWGDPNISYAKMMDNFVDQDEYGAILDRFAKEKYPHADDPWEQAVQEKTTGDIYAKATEEQRSLAEERLKQESPEYQDIMSRLGKGEDPNKVFGRYPAVDFLHNSEMASMVMDPGTILPAHSPEGMLASKWNTIEDLPPFNVRDVDRHEWYGKFMEDYYQQLMKEGKL